MSFQVKCCFALVLILALVPAMYAQDVRASISGNVTDPSGAAVVDATVTATNTATNATVVTKTNTSGLYLTPFLAPGAYQLTVEAAGFKRYFERDIKLQTLDKLRLDVQLQLGAVSDSVTVEAAVATIQTETASRSQIISNEMIANIPTQGRNPFQIVWAAPGVVKSGGWRYLRSFDIGGTTGFSVNGGRASESEVLQDGISNVQSSRQVIHVPTMDSVAEFKILTNNYDAQYGRTGGGVVTIVTKSGSNDMHGIAYEYFQNAKLNANQTELNAAGTAKSPNHINAYGFEAGGPVFIPKVFNGKNKLFWMVAYEGMKQRSADPGVQTVPIMDIRGGDFTNLLNGSGQQILIYDPLTTQSDGSRTPFAGNKIPSNRLNTVAVNALKYYPAPTSAGTGPNHVLNYPYPSRWIGDLSQWIGRVDYAINPKNNVYFRYGQNPYQEFRGLVFMQNLSPVNPAEPTGNAPLIRNGRTWNWDWTSTLSPHMTFDLRAGLSRWEETTGTIFGTGFDQNQLGFDPNLTKQFTRIGFPMITFNTSGGNDYQQFGPSRLTSYNTNSAYTIQPNLNMVVGKHFLKFGAEGRRYDDFSLNPGVATGSYDFTKMWTQANKNTGDAVSGNAVASYLLGYPNSAYDDRNIDPAFTHYFYAGFFQDDWKATSRLTVNMGLRWDTELGVTERYDRMVKGVDLNAASPIASSVSGLALKGQVLFANLNGQSRRSYNADTNNFAPRIGLAYRLGDKWVIRGGYGLYYLGMYYAGSNQGYSQRTNATISTDGLTPAVNLTNAFALQPNGQLYSAVGNSQGAGSFLGQAPSMIYQNAVAPYSHQYSFDIQRELPGSMLLEVGYVGNQTRKLPLTAGVNYLPTAQMGQASSYYTTQVPNPMAGLIPLAPALNGTTIQRQYLLYAYPQYGGGFNLNDVPMGKQRYDSAQIKVTRRFSKGLTFLASYTISKTLEQTYLLNAQDFNLSDPSSTPLVKQSASSSAQIDVPQKFNLAGVYELPFGKGKPLASNIPGVVNQIIGGWELNYNITYMKGWAFAYPNNAQVTPGSAKLSNPTMAQWFNTSLWNNANGTRVGSQAANTLRTYPYYFSDVRSPGYRNWDASVTKYFPIHDRLRLQFRFEMVNAFNHPWFTALASTDVTSASFGRLNPTQNNLPRFIKLGLNMQW
jgi:hypothetical protein